MAFSRLPGESLLIDGVLITVRGFAGHTRVLLEVHDPQNRQVVRIGREQQVQGQLSDEDRVDVAYRIRQMLGNQSEVGE